MNLSDNLKKIRKDNNLSQEQLAEKLGVSRQSVSKWESGLAYPEMDKMLQLCQLFNLNIDELLNQDLKEVNNEKQTKNNINRFIDDFLEYVTKTVDMFSGMRFKDKIKCLFEQCFLILFIFILALIIGTIGSNIISNLISFLPDSIYFTVYSIIEALYCLVVLVFGITLILHIFKVRYLDYYLIIKDKEIEFDDEDEELKTDEDIKKIDKKNNIIIRDPKHSGYRFISTLLSILLFGLKTLVSFIGFVFCLSLILFVCLLVMSFLISKTGLFFIGLLLSLISCIVVNIVILIFIYNFIVSKKNKKGKLALTFLISLIIAGVGIGFMFVGFSKFEKINNNTNVMINTFEMNDDLFFYSYVSEIEYIESDNKDVEVVCNCPDYYNIDFVSVDDGYYFNSWFDETDLNVINKLIEDFNNKKIVDYNNKIYIYTTKDNIKILNDNLSEHFNELY